MERRIERLEGLHRPEPEPFRFTFAPEPPEHLSEAEKDAWHDDYRRDCEARGVHWFTLDLKAAGTGLREDV